MDLPCEGCGAPASSESISDGTGRRRALCAKCGERVKAPNGLQGSPRLAAAPRNGAGATWRPRAGAALAALAAREERLVTEARESREAREAGEAKGAQSPAPAQSAGLPTALSSSAGVPPPTPIAPRAAPAAHQEGAARGDGRWRAVALGAAFVAVAAIAGLVGMSMGRGGGAPPPVLAQPAQGTPPGAPPQIESKAEPKVESRAEPQMAQSEPTPTAEVPRAPEEPQEQIAKRPKRAEALLPRRAKPEPKPKQEQKEVGAGGARAGAEPESGSEKGQEKGIEASIRAAAAGGGAGGAEVDAQFDKLIGARGGAARAAEGAEAAKQVYVPPAVAEKRSAPPGEKEIMAVVVGQKGAVKGCVAAQRERTPELSGSVVMRWTIRPDGGTGAIQGREGASEHEELAGCLAKLIKGWRFPPYEGDPMPPIDFPFKF